MLDAIRSFFERRVARAAAAGPSPAPGADLRAAQVAACALLLELAHADDEFSVQEQAHIENALARHFGLDEGTVEDLIRLANAEREKSIDHFQFTRLIAEHFDLGQKMVLAEVMWGVILADGTISEHEAYIIRKVANLLDLEPAYLSQARRAASSQP